MTTPPDLPDIAVLEAQRQELIIKNSAEVQALAALGASIDPASLMSLRLETLIEFIFARLGNTSQEVRDILSTSFELEYEQKVANSLVGVRSEVRKAMLGMGAQMNEQDVKKLWRGQNGHGGKPGG